MINPVTSNQNSNLIGTIKSSNKSAAENSQKASELSKSEKVDKIEIGKNSNNQVTYSDVSKTKKTDTATINALKAEADKATENLRKLVEDLILKQNKNYKPKEAGSSPAEANPSLSQVSGVEQAKLAIADDGEFGVDAVSDRLVDFAIAVSGGDKSKLDVLVSAIDVGFAAARDKLGGELPEISNKTYDETMRKLRDWASETDN